VFRARTVNLAAQLLDLELEMTDQRFHTRDVRLGIGRLGAGIDSPRIRWT
jgi:hypothetical protein